MKEIWKDIKNYENFYQVSNLGRIKRLERITCDGRKIKELIKKPTLSNNHYLMVWLQLNNNTKAYLVHRLVAETFIPNPNSLPQVNHKDENKLNNCVDNLEWCTNKYNNNYGSKPYKQSLIRKGKKLSNEQKKKISNIMKKIVKNKIRNNKGQFIKKD